MKKQAPFLLPIVFILSLVFGCGQGKEITSGEAEGYKTEFAQKIISKTVKKPGGQPYAAGKVGGTWVTTITNDPKTFNTMMARDGDSRDVVDNLFDYLADYDPNKREFKPNLAEFEIKVDEANDKLDVIYTLRDDIYWTTPADPGKKVKVTSDDPVFWYNEIEGDKTLQQPGYAGQFIKMKDGSEARVTIEKIDERRFVYHYPRIVSNPILSTNSTFGPRYVYEKAKKEKGIDGVLNIYGVDTNVKTIPSIGPYYITEYTPGVRVVLERNPHYWKKDPQGISYPYIEKVIFKIVPDTNTEYLLFKGGEKDSYTVRPEDLESLIDAPKPDYAVYNGGESLGSGFFSFNQNPKSMKPHVNAWFVQKKFRQAMSCMLNRARIINQVYRGLAVPALHFFAKPNPYYDEAIKLEYTYNPEQAVKLLGEIGIKKDDKGVMKDKDGNGIEFEITLGAENNLGIDMATIFSDDLKQIGINAKVRPIDFQKVVDMLISTYEWECVTVSLGSNYWPEGGSNVWQSNGNFHLWRPLQDKPATDWEAKVDELYNDGLFTIDKAKAKVIYDEYQRILLDELPVIYIAFPTSFLAVRDRWDNVFYDTLNSIDTRYVFLKDTVK